MTGVLDRPAPAPDLTVPYGAAPEQVIDLRLPPPRRRRLAAPGAPGAPGAGPPLIVLVHGGFWRPAYDRRHLGPMAAALAAAGYAVAVPEYRRAGMAEEGWTGPFTDIAAALDQVGAIAGAYGADTSRITWAGHSAGGHLVLWAAARAGLPDGSPWRGSLGPGSLGPGSLGPSSLGPCPATHVVSLAGCSSLRLCAEWNLGAGAVHLLMGGGPDEVPDRYAVADPAALPAPPIPVTLIHGDDDDTVPLRMSQLFTLSTSGRLVEIPGAGHFDLIDPQSRAWPRVLSALADPAGRPLVPVVSPRGQSPWSVPVAQEQLCPSAILMTRKGTACWKAPQS
jgi:pimeloyl-ACP methyl ester carboxylesterase